MYDVTFSWTQVLLSPLFFIVLGLPSLFLLIFAQPYQRGIYCDDPINYPKATETFSSGLVAFLGFIIPFIGILIFEAWRLRIEKKSGYSTDVAYQIGARKVHRLGVRLYVLMGYWVLGLAMAQFLEDVCKYGVGRPRPCFAAMCIPDWSKINCFNTTTKSPNYVYPVPCLQTDWFKLKDARLSFPSGHTTFAFYNFVFLILYIEARVYWTIGLTVIKRFIQFLLFAFAVGIAVSVVSDYEHNASDSIAGALLGTAVALVMGIYGAKLFQRREIPEGKKEEQRLLLRQVPVMNRV